MSTLLKEAIIDAKALRDAALKTAESSIVEKYSDEVRTALDKLLEQEDPLAADPMAADPMAADPMAADPLAADPMMGIEGAEGAEVEDIVDGVPLSATDNLSEMEGEGLKHLEDEGENVKVTVDLDALAEAIESLQTETGGGGRSPSDPGVAKKDIAGKQPKHSWESEEDDELEEEIDINEEDLIKMVAEATAGITAAAQEEADVDAMDSLEGGGKSSGGSEAVEADVMGTEDEEGEKQEEGLEIPDELIDAIAEKLTVDMGATLGGWAGRSSESQKWEMGKEIAHRRTTDVKKDLDVLRKAQEELVFENKQLKASNKKYKQAVGEIKETLQEVNISNARLLYTNRVLRNTSLNERQKDKIAEAISNAGSVMEAKTIFETLESAAPAQTKRAPQSLSEAINRPSSIIRASRREAQTTDPFLDRMKRLAGIKNN